MLQGCVPLRGLFSRNSFAHPYQLIGDKELQMEKALQRVMTEVCENKRWLINSTQAISVRNAI